MNPEATGLQHPQTDPTPTPTPHYFPRAETLFRHALVPAIPWPRPGARELRRPVHSAMESRNEGKTRPPRPPPAPADAASRARGCPAAPTANPPPPCAACRAPFAYYFSSGRAVSAWRASFLIGTTTQFNASESIPTRIFSTPSSETLDSPNSELGAQNTTNENTPNYGPHSDSQRSQRSI